MSIHHDDYDAAVRAAYATARGTRDAAGVAYDAAYSAADDALDAAANAANAAYNAYIEARIVVILDDADARD